MKLGNVDIAGIKVGNSDVTRLMYGDIEVWSAQAPAATFVEGSALVTSSDVNNTDVLQHTHVTTSPQQSGNTAILWVVMTDGNNGQPWASREGLTAIATVDAGSFSDDHVIFVEFPSWSSAGTNITRTFDLRPIGGTQQGIHVVSFEVENLATSNIVDDEDYDLGSSSTSALTLNVTPTVDGTLLLAVGMTSAAMSATLNGFTTIFTQQQGGSVPSVHVSYLHKATAGAQNGPTYTAGSAVRWGASLLALRPKP